MIGRKGPGPERPGPDYPPEWDREPAEEDRCTCLPYPYGTGPEIDCPVHGEERTSEPNDGPGPDGHHTVTGECFACMVGVSTGPESHGDRCPMTRKQHPCSLCGRIPAEGEQHRHLYAVGDTGEDAEEVCVGPDRRQLDYAPIVPDPWATIGPMPPPPF